MRLLKKYWWLIAIVLIVVGFIAFRPKTASTKKVIQHTVKRQDLTQSLVLSGKVDAAQKATLRFQTSGRLAWVGVNEGDWVNQWQALASLDARDVKAALQKKLNAYLDTRYTFDQTLENNEGEIIDDALKRILDKSQLGLSNSVLDVEIQNLALEYATLTTPISGIVTSIGTKLAGINVTPSQAEFVVVNPNSVYLSVTADQSEVGQIHNGMLATLTFDAFDEETQTGSVSAIAFTPKSGESSTVYEIKVSLPKVDNNYKYRIDMTADAVFTMREKKDTLAIPTSAITTKDGKSTVQKVTGKSITTVPITLGEEYDSMTEVTGGLSEGDVIND
jgi:RND family efflux transporter MFP subunit